METFKFRLNCVDHYQATPTSLDPVLFQDRSLSQRRDGPKIPVIRVFGATETGQKVCAHIHGFLPYVYVEYTGSLEKNVVASYIQRFRASIDQALALSYRRISNDERALFVGYISLVKGVPFFGYHVGYKFFLKIYMLNPLNMTRLSDLLLQGAIMGQPFQPYESHLQYLLQWMCDFNLYGCAYINCSRVQFREPVPASSDVCWNPHRWHDESIFADQIGRPDEFPRLSHCAIEVDIHVQDILNRNDVRNRPIHHDFDERFFCPSPDEKFVNSMASLWKDETRRRKRKLGLSDPGSSPFPPEVMVSMSADVRNTDKGGWIHEDEYRGMINELIRVENVKSRARPATFANFVQTNPLESSVQLAQDSIEDLFPAKLSRSRYDSDSTENSLESLLANATQNAVVDESIVNSIGSGGLDDELSPVNGDESHSNPPQDTLAKEGISRTKQQSSNEQMTSSTELSRDLKDSLLSTPKDALDKQGKAAVITDGDLDATPPPSTNFRSFRKRKAAETTAESQQQSSSQPNRSGKSPRVNGRSRSSMNATGNRRPEKSRDRKSKPWASSQDSETTLLPAQSSQTSIKANDENGPRIGFPVTKNAFDAETSLRPSQRYEHASPSKLKASDRKTSESSESNLSPKLTMSRRKSASAAVSSREIESDPRAALIAGNLQGAFRTHRKARMVCLGALPPSAEVVTSTMTEFGVPQVIYQDAFYSNELDVPKKARDYAGREFKLESGTVPFLPPFDSSGTSLPSSGRRPPMVIDIAKVDSLHADRRKSCTLRNWEVAILPPHPREVRSWLQSEASSEKRSKAKFSNQKTNDKDRAQDERIPSQIEGPTQHTHGFKYSQKPQTTSVNHETQYMSVMSLEIHANSRENLAPDPAEDEVCCVFWCVQSDDKGIESSSGQREGKRIGVVVLAEEEDLPRSIERELGVEVSYEDSELELMNRVVSLVREFDPDILTGYEVHNGSWGYLIERARVKYEFDMCNEVSRMKSQSHGRFGKDADRWGFRETSTITVTGRHMINIWRAMRSECNLLQYTMENVVFNLLHKRIPHYSFPDLTRWYNSGQPHDLGKLLHYFISRVQLNIEILEANELVPRISEQARLLGVDFFSVISRGSQFKVESLMSRIAKPESFMLVSPSKKQVGSQNALECLPLVMEPQSDFYNSPLLVLDFQSLYPSIMIAYNYCYSTFFGRIVNWRGHSKMGFTNYERDPALLRLLKDHINIAPNGIMYVRPELRKSLLAKMLGEILETRVMVKSGMKVEKDDKILQKLLNNRQLALKLIANVTYGYTSASFSGRMPCSEIADSIVQTGRETLEKAIALIHSVEKWDAEVVYGDTDSLFVYLKGRSREQAFKIGNEIAEAITNANPRPVKLKFEKVYHPCVLLAKKRYVGFKYESPSQNIPEFDAKGIETVRRDGTPAEQKIEEKALKLLFRTSDLSQVKTYFQRQCAKIMLGRVSIQDFLFAKEVRLGTYADKGLLPPGAMIATKRMLADHRAEPQYGERVPYVVVTGAPGARLIDRCVAPETLLKDDTLQLDAEYYISKNLIPPLERIFNLVGANVRSWYDEMPKVQRVRDVGADTTNNAANAVTTATAAAAANALANGSGSTTAFKKTLENYMRSSVCLVCRARLAPPQAALLIAPTSEPSPDTHHIPLCKDCLSRPALTLLSLRQRLQEKERRVAQVESVCRSCSGLAPAEEVRCDSRDCGVFYTRVKEGNGLRLARGGVGPAIEVLEGMSARKATKKKGARNGKEGAGGLDW